MVLNKGNDLFLVEVIDFKCTKITLILRNYEMSCCLLKSQRSKVRKREKSCYLEKSLFIDLCIVFVNAICVYL